jgi:hypothetical protein
MLRNIKTNGTDHRKGLVLVGTFICYDDVQELKHAQDNRSRLLLTLFFFRLHIAHQTCPMHNYANNTRTPGYRSN